MCHHVSFWKAPAHADIIEFSNFLLSLKNLRSGGQNCLRLFYYLNFERNDYVLKSKNSWILLNKNINFNKKQKEIENGRSYTQFQRDKPCASVRIRVTTVMSWSSQKKKRPSFVLLILSEGNFLRFVFYLNV